MRDCHINLQPKKSAKQQALEVIRQLKAVDRFKIAPAMMEILISLDPKLVDSVSPNILKLVYQIIRQEKNSEGIFELGAIIEPENYHALSNHLEELAKNRFCIEIMGPGRSSESRKLASSSGIACNPTTSASSTVKASTIKSSKKMSASEPPRSASLSDLPEEEAESMSLSTKSPSPTSTNSVKEDNVKIERGDDHLVAAKQQTRQQKNKKRNKKNKFRDDDYDDANDE